MSLSNTLLCVRVCVCVCVCVYAARLSLDTMAMDSDGERDDDEETQKNLFESIQEQSPGCAACPGDETDGFRLRVPCPRARVTSMVIKEC